ncbi:MAG TPA: SDR family oxidoreductase [Nitrososphaeraceae archaeon]|jgi:3-oxoacyl-[acyl-carrier protein] reductase
MNEQKIALVTGGTRGIGRETAILLAKMNFNVAICSRTQEDIDTLIKDTKAMGSKGVMGRKCDVSRSSEVNAFVCEVLNIYGRIDFLINNAGIAYVKKLIDTTEEEWDRTLDINLKGIFLFCKAIVPHMMTNNFGVIINVSSGAGRIGFENISAYCASKFGIIGLTESLGWEVTNSNIRVMTICPGEVATRMQRDVDPHYFESNKHKILRAETVAQKIIDMMVDDKKYRNGDSVDLPN